MTRKTPGAPPSAASQRERAVIAGYAPHIQHPSDFRDSMAAHRWPFYMYALCDADGRVFYIGKGKRLRALHHLREAAAGRPGAKCDEIRRIGDRVRIALLLSCADEHAALVAEHLFISDLWGTNSLTNAVCPGMPRAPKAPNPLLHKLLNIIKQLDAMSRSVDLCAKRFCLRFPQYHAELFPEAICLA